MSELINNKFKVNDENDGIDLSEILVVSLRRKFIVGSFSLVSFVVSAIYAFSIPKVWEGNFQIVLSDNNNSTTLSSLASSRLAQLAGINIGTKGNQLKTEVEVLKSPSLLLKVFEFVKKKKSNGSKNLDMKFIHWKGALDIELSRDTSVLNITYQDNDKDLVLPVLNKLSNIYQDYSGKKRRREIEIAMNYLEKEIQKYKIKNIESLRNEEDFAIANDIGIYTTDSKPFIKSTIENSPGMDNNLSLQPVTTNVEILRLKAVNKLRNITFKLKSLNESLNTDEFINVIEDIPQLKKPRAELKIIESKIAKNSAIFKENDESIRLLKKQKNEYEKFIKDSYRKILESEKSIAEAEIKAAERPKGVITKYKELYGQSLLDANTLMTLENQYRIIELENAKISDPWELITNPTLLYYPVAPQKKKIAFVATVIGTILGIITALIYDRSRNIIFSIKDISSLVRWKVIDVFSSSNINSWNEPLEIIANNYKNKNENKLGIFLLSSFTSEEKEIISKSFSNFLEKNSFKVSEEFNNLLNYESFITFIKLGSTNKSKLITANQYLNLQEKNMIGLIAIKDK